MNILGIWDGHDSGAAIVAGHSLIAAANEERFTRRKLEVAFPRHSIEACCRLAGITPARIDVVACCTTDLAKTVGRVFPSTRERYYQIRRRTAAPGRLADLQKRFKYRLTEWRPNAATRALSEWALRRTLAAAGLSGRLCLYDHHACHATAAAQASRFDPCTVLTIDGVGDGLSSTVSTYEGGRLNRIAATPARHSLGIFFEHVTNLLNMRELEDEGKVMALADYGACVPDEANPLMKLVGVDDLRFTTAVPGHALAGSLRRVLWRYPNEQFAAMAQRTVEDACVRLARQAVRRTGHRRIALGGGVASNVKANRRIRLMEEIEDVFVFPHMGDGGLAVGAALLAAREHGVAVELLTHDLGWGPQFGVDELRTFLDGRGIEYTTPPDIAASVAELLCGDRIVSWFQGPMEYGPRALGHRSVLARSDRPALRDRLNLIMKRRVWYQPFCPSLLERDAERLLSDYSGAPNRHMTMAYMVADQHRATLAGVINIDGSCRPHIVDEDAPDVFAQLLRHMRARVGHGAVLNTSFNIHGQPLVCTPEEALEVFTESGADALALGPFLVMASS